LRGPRRAARERCLGRGRARDAVELRSVRRDHRQGRPPDPARGRRRAALPGGLETRISLPVSAFCRGVLVTVDAAFELARIRAWAHGARGSELGSCLTLEVAKRRWRWSPDRPG